eukprot:TRINITY_DN47562_c0_g1_i1.p1 TRINITY_DN47562_c0_g1~~TRINITY_DN47562_c0_g1_i1.p1  ORF type:complete len:548 (-),score=83.08 TRINITY_DN47562_c0_g1_i1:32-1675(-)
MTNAPPAMSTLSRNSDWSGMAGAVSSIGKPKAASMPPTGFVTNANMTNARPTVSTGSNTKIVNGAFTSVALQGDAIIRAETRGIPHHYVLRGQGYCSKGYYTGWDPAEAVDLETCQSICSSEDQCVYLSWKPNLTCSRFDSLALPCKKLEDPREGYTTYKKVLDACDWSKTQVLPETRCKQFFAEKNGGSREDAEMLCQSSSTCTGIIWFGNLTSKKALLQLCIGRPGSVPSKPWSVIVKPKDCKSLSEKRLASPQLPPPTCPIAKVTKSLPDGPSTNHTLNNQSSLEVVISAFNENLSFIEPLLAPVPDAKLRLYCSGNQSLDRRCEEVPDRGGENYVYLQHIINNYDQLANVTVFSVASIMRNHNNQLLCRKLSYVLEKVRPAMRAKFTGFCTLANTFPGEFNNFNPHFNIKEYESQKWGRIKLCRPSVEPLGSWYKHFVDMDLQRPVCSGVLFNDIFAVSAERIRRWPKETYQRLLDELARCGTLRSVADHFMERSWKAMLDDYEFPSAKALRGPDNCPIKTMITLECRRHDTKQACPFPPAWM